MNLKVCKSVQRMRGIIIHILDMIFLFSHSFSYSDSFRFFPPLFLSFLSHCLHLFLSISFIPSLSLYYSVSFSSCFFISLSFAPSLSFQLPLSSLFFLFPSFLLSPLLLTLSLSLALFLSLSLSLSLSFSLSICYLDLS